MRDLMRFLAFAVAVWMLPSMAAAQRDSEDERDRPICGAANSTPVTISALWANEHRLLRRCVAIEGYRIGDIIFTDQLALYRALAGDDPAPSGIVGIPYPAHHLDDDPPGLRRGTYYGRVESCRVAQRGFARTLRRLRSNWQESDGEIVLVHLYGFCATSAGPAIRAESGDEQLVSGLHRLTGDRLRARLGELLPTDEGYPHRAILPWLVDIATSGCESDFDRPRRPSGGPTEGVGATVDLPNLGQDQRELVSQWCATATRQHAVFEVADRSTGRDPNRPVVDVLICLCVTGDCMDRWPVALIDAGWSANRPYFCQRVTVAARSYGTDDSGRMLNAIYVYEFRNKYIGPWLDWGFPERPPN